MFRLKRLLVIFLFSMGFAIQAHSQVCKEEGSLEVRVQDENEKSVPNASIRFLNLPLGSDLTGSEFTEYVQPFGSLYVAKFCQSDILAKENLKSGDRKNYNLAVSAEGHIPTTTSVSIQHCVGQCLVNRAFVTVVTETARIVSVKGTVEYYVSNYDEKGRVVSVKKTAPGAFIRFKRGAMVEFFTKSGPNGKYEIRVPAGDYSVYARSPANGFMGAEYFGNFVGHKNSTNFNIMLSFFGEG